MGSLLDKLYERDEEDRAAEKQIVQADADKHIQFLQRAAAAEKAAKMSIRDYVTGDIHQVRAILITDAVTHVWSKTWKGMHMIGMDCEFVKS